MKIAVLTDLQRWRDALDVELLAEDGPLSLASVFRLPEGLTTVGGSPDNDVSLAWELRPPARVGTFTYGDQVLLFTPDVQCPSVVDDLILSGTIRLGLETPSSIQIGPLRLLPRWQGGVVVEVRSSLAPARLDFGGLRWYPPQARGLLTGWLEGDLLRFDWQGQTYLWKTHREAGSWYVDFGDLTNGETTCPVGRRLHFGTSGEGRVILDFNRALTHPDGRTPFLPPPPPLNRLGVPLELGERHPHWALSLGSGI